MNFSMKFLKNSFFGPFIFLIFYFTAPIILIKVFKINFFSFFYDYFFIFGLLIIFSEILFLFIYKWKNKIPYNKIPKLPFNKIIVEPHPNLPFINKKNFLPTDKLSKLSFPLNKNSYEAPRLKTNNLGYNNGFDGGRDILTPKPNNIFRINCLGASTTQYYLKEGANTYSYPMSLENILNEKGEKYEVNNCGSGGYASSDILVRFLLQNIDTNPNAVILYHAYNDIRSYLTSDFKSDYSHSRKNLGESYFKFYLGSLMPNLPLKFLNYLQNKFFPQNHRYTLIETISKGNFDISNVENIELGLNAYKRNIQNIITVCKHNKIQIILCTFCFYLHDKVKNSETHNLYKKIVIKENEIIKNLAEINNIDIVDAYNLIPQKNENFIDTIHFTPAGMRLLATEISKKLNVDSLN
jgi:lysophospholipase L1-like esterase